MILSGQKCHTNLSCMLWIGLQLFGPLSKTWLFLCFGWCTCWPSSGVAFCLCNVSSVYYIHCFQSPETMSLANHLISCACVNTEEGHSGQNVNFKTSIRIN